MERDFSDFVAVQHARLFRTVYLILGDYQTAEDVLQATYVKALVRWRRIASLTDPPAYIRRMAINQARSWWRRPSARELVTEVVDMNAPSPPAASLAEHDVVWSAVLTLPPRQRAVVVLRFYEDLSEAETADALGMAVGTVKSHCHAACRKLAGLLEEPSPPAEARRETR